MRHLTSSLLAAADVLGSREEAWSAALDVVAHAHGLGPAPVHADLLAPFTEPGAADLLGAVHETTVEGRGASGTFYTPSGLVEWVLAQTLDPLLDDGLVPRVLDPACGAGAFLVAAVRRVVARTGVAPEVHGVDLDPVAVAICRLLVRIEAPDVVAYLTVGDGLEVPDGAPFDAVVGNPPFLGQLRRATSSARARPGAYTDTSALFLQQALGLVRPGGRVGMVQPLSLLAARDAAPVRAAVTTTGALTAFWSSLTPVFPGTSVLTCAPVVEVAGEQGPVTSAIGPALEPGPAVPLPDGPWGPLAAPAAGIPSVALDAGHGVLGDLATCTADFRDQYYGLVPFVREGGAGAPLVTSGLIEPAASRWGTASTRFAKVRYERPTVDVAALRAEGALAGWADARLVPKVLVATQGRVIEAVVDADGAWLPSVPVLTLTAPVERLWHVLAVLLSPPVVAHAAARYLGTALSPSAIKLSAAQVAALPLPGDAAAWDEGARLARLAQEGTDGERSALLAACATAMCDAYDDRDALAWWLGRC